MASRPHVRILVAHPFKLQWSLPEHEQQPKSDCDHLPSPLEDVHGEFGGGRSCLGTATGWATACTGTPDTIGTACAVGGVDIFSTGLRYLTVVANFAECERLLPYAVNVSCAF